MKKSALVTGASGAIGRSLIDELLAEGYKVKALARQTSKLSGLPDAVELMIGDINDRGSLQRAVSGVSKIFHLAALLHLNNPSPEMRVEYRRVNVEGTRALVEVAKAANVERVIFFSTINVYGASRPGEIFDEESAVRPDSYYAESKLEGERIVLDEASGGVLRVAAVYGARMKGNYPRLLQALKSGRFVMIGDGSNRRTLVHVRDLCRAARRAAESERAAGQIFNITDGHVHTLREIIDAMSAAVGKRSARFTLPTRYARMLAGFLEDGLSVIGKCSPVNRSTIDKFVEDIAVSGEKMQTHLGYTPDIDLAEGWRKTVGKMNESQF
jgi:UDP-glucose 4-epimerase